MVINVSICSPQEETEETPADLSDPAAASTSLQEQTVLLQDDSEGFTLQPVETPSVKPGQGRSKPRKRILVVDDVKNISGEEMKSQLSDTSDIVNNLDLAPPTKRLMHWKETGKYFFSFLMFDFLNFVFD